MGAVFRGINALNLDVKGRVAMPTRHHDQIKQQCDGQLIVTVDRDRCLLVYPQNEWELIEQKLSALPNLAPQARSLQRLLIGHATECSMDKSGRVLITPPLREFAALDKRVVLIGQGNKFELWDEAVWNTRCESWLAAGQDEGPLSTELETLSL
jgi:MraZ protein